jgi:acetyl esterase/lipase
MRDDVRRAFDYLAQLVAMPPDAPVDEAIRIVRQAMERYGDLVAQPPLPAVHLQGVEIGSLAAEWVVPPGADPRRRLLHLHGGSLLAGSLSSHRRLVTSPACASNCATLHIAYRLGPEHTFPAAHDDCAAAFEWIAEHGPEGASPARALGVSGDSIGAGLAADIVAQAVSRSGPVPAVAAMLCPTLDLNNTPHRPARESDPLINAELVAASALYAAGTALSHPRLSPLHMDDALVARFPPTLIQTSSAEYLMPDALGFAQRLARNGRRVSLSAWPELPHLWHLFGDYFPEGRAAIAEAGGFIAAHLR